MNAVRLVRSPDAGHRLPGGQASRDSACTPRRNISGRASKTRPPRRSSQPKGFSAFLASPRASDRQPASGVCAVTARKAVMGVASGPDPPHARRELPRDDLHIGKANMESASHASVWDVGYFPPCAVASSCGIGGRPRAASRASMPAPRTAHPAVQDVQRPRHEYLGDGAALSPGEVPTRVLNWCFCVSMPGTLKGRLQDSQPLGNALMCQDVSGRFRTCQSHRSPSPTGRKNAPATSRQAARAPQRVAS